MRHVVIVTGSRDWDDECAIYRELDNACPDLVVQGGARGADSIARAWCRHTGIECKTFEANWRQHGRRAGPLRNELMLNSYPQAHLLAFPLNGPGTWDCIRRANDKRMSIKVFDVHGESLRMRSAIIEAAKREDL